jgi:hypothetical protein
VLHCQIDTFFQLSWANSSFYFLQTFLIYCSCENCCSCSAIPCFVISPNGNTFDQICSNIGGLVSELNRLGDSDSVLCYFGLTEALVDEDIAPVLKVTYPPGPSVTATACSRLTHPSSIFLRAAAPNSNCLDAKYRTE